MQAGARLLESFRLWSLYDYSKPSDDYLHYAMKEKRYIGGSDRRFIRDLFYKFLRQHIVLEEKVRVLTNILGTKPKNPFDYYRWMFLIYLKENDAKSLNLLTGEKFHPEIITETEQKVINHCPVTPRDEAASHNLTPFWYGKLKVQFGDSLKENIDALDKEAPLDLRINTLKLTVEDAQDLLMEEGVQSTLLPFSPYGLRVAEKSKFPNELIQEGLFEPQDEGSQLITLLCDVKPGLRVVDFCAGAGGKTLGLAMQMENKGHIIASDISEHRLKRARERLKRLDLHNVMVKVLDQHWIKKHKMEFDRVLVDAPCSGSGTWRRNPDLKVRTTGDDLFELIQKQRDILTQAARLVKKGGRLIYGTCSLLRDENDAQIEWFLENNADFKLVDLTQVWQQLSTNALPCSTPTFSLTPLEHGMDGFFVGCMERTS